MQDILESLLDWKAMEDILYSECDNPHDILGAHCTEEGVVVLTFIPEHVESVKLKYETGETFDMEAIDGEYQGFFAILLEEKKINPYTFLVTYNNNVLVETADAYNFEPQIDAVDITKFENGICYNIYEKLGAHVMEINGVKGTYFALWAPNALRVSVVGDFNNWDGRRHQMRKLKEAGIFEIFIPNIKEGDIYKYELKLQSKLPVLKSDPYGYYAQMRPDNASVVYDISKHKWKDRNWLKKRAKTDVNKEPMIIYELHLGSWKKPNEEGRIFYNYRELAPMLAEYVKEMGYTHIELMPIMEHPFDGSWGYQVTGYYSATSRYGTPDDFMYFMDYMHQNDIGVILDWVPAHFPRDTFGLACFDGTCLYEHLDPRQGSHPHWGTLIYNYGRPQVKNFLISNVLFWIEKYHADAIRMDAVASMLYLDYGKDDGQWVANMYGGNENLEAIEFLKHLNSIVRGRNDGTLVIAEESTAWPKVTTKVEEDGLGFNLKWNMGWMNDFLDYMKTDPIFRKGKHGELTFSMIYAYSENFILVLSHDEVVHGKCSMINKMPGDKEDKFASLRVAYGFMMAHPGKKLLFMGQDFAQYREWSEERSLDWELMEQEENLQFHNYFKALITLYRDYPAFYQLDYDPEGFEWINSIDADKSIVTFLRKTKNKNETLLIVCNFTPVVYENFKIGVPFKGKYKETFNSDNTVFGGKGNINPRLKQSKEDECDERENSIRITIPPLGIAVFTCTPSIEEKKTRNKKTQIKVSEEKAKSTTKKKGIKNKSKVTKKDKNVETKQ